MNKMVRCSISSLLRNCSRIVFMATARWFFTVKVEIFNAMAISSCFSPCSRLNLNTRCCWGGSRCSTSFIKCCTSWWSMCSSVDLSYTCPWSCIFDSMSVSLVMRRKWLTAWFWAIVNIKAPKFSILSSRLLLFHSFKKTSCTISWASSWFDVIFNK